MHPVVKKLPRREPGVVQILLEGGRMAGGEVFVAGKWGEVDQIQTPALSFEGGI
jgi:hypothetical protein